MMYNYPFSSFPYFRRYSSNPSMYYGRTNFSSPKTYKNPSDFSKGYYNNNSNLHTIKEEPKNSNTRNSTSNGSYGFSFLNNFFHQTDRDENESYFDLFGLKLYNDDLLLIGLIFFLYKEDVKDQYLFIALILLLLS